MKIGVSKEVSVRFLSCFAMSGFLLLLLGYHVHWSNTGNLRQMNSGFFSFSVILSLGNFWKKGTTITFCNLWWSCILRRAEILVEKMPKSSTDYVEVSSCHFRNCIPLGIVSKLSIPSSISLAQSTILVLSTTIRPFTSKVILVWAAISQTQTEFVGCCLAGALVRSTKGSRNHAQEMIENLHVLQHAKRHSMDRTMSTDFASFLSTRLRGLNINNSSNNQCLVLKHKCTQEDQCLRRIFPNAALDFYQVLYLGDTRLTIRSYSHRKTSDDSNILFRMNGSEKFGRIRSIVYVNGASPIFYVAHLRDGSPLVCPIDASSNFEFTMIQISPSTTWSYTLMNVDDFIEKTVFFESPDRRSCFYRFPNLCHSS